MLLQFLNEDYFFFFRSSCFFFFCSQRWIMRKNLYAILACTHVVIFNFKIFLYTFVLLLGAFGQVKWLDVSVLFMAMTRENAIDQPHLVFTQPIINVFAYFVCFRSINQALKMRKLPFHHKHTKANTSRTKYMPSFCTFWQSSMLY